jgi:hypothetical protein
MPASPTAIACKTVLALGALALLPACATTVTPATGHPNPPPPPGYRVECVTTALPFYYRDARCVPGRQARFVSARC